MNFPHWTRWLFATGAISLIAVFAACGDDDDDSNGDSGGDANGGGGEEEYVADLCSAFLGFRDTFEDLSATPENADASDEEALELIEPPLETLVNAVDDIEPPGDIQEFHEALVTNFRDGLEQVKVGNPEGLAAIAALEVPTPAADVRSKYQALADENPDCAAAGVSFA